MAKVGYARVSTQDQHPEAQAERLLSYGCEPDLIFTDHGVSGAKASRPEWDRCLAQLRKGDVLVAVRLDRIGRSVKNVIAVLEDLKAREVGLVFLDQGIDTTSTMGEFFFTVLAAFAQLERRLIQERTRDGLAATTARGRSGGRPQRLSADQRTLAAKLRSDGHSIREIGILLGNGKPVSRQTVYRALGELPADSRQAKHAEMAPALQQAAQPQPSAFVPHVVGSFDPDHDLPGSDAKQPA